jgi:hypothetical protein
MEMRRASAAMNTYSEYLLWITKHSIDKIVISGNVQIDYNLVAKRELSKRDSTLNLNTSHLHVRLSHGGEES